MTAPPLSGWREVELRDLITELDAGVSVNSEDRPIRSGEVGVLKTSCVTTSTFDPSQHKAVIDKDVGRVATPVQRDRIIMSRMNTAALVGASAYVEGNASDLYLPDRLWQFGGRQGVADSRWLGYVLGSQGVRRILSRIATGTSGSMKNLKKEQVRSLEVLLPPLDEQRGIAATLQAMDDAITADEAVVEQLDRVRHDLMAHLLLGRDAVTWPTIKLGEAGEWLSGGTPNKARPELWAGPVPWVSPKDMKRSRIGAAEDHVSEDAATKGTRFVQPGTLLMVVRGMILAHTFPVALTTATVAFNQDIKALRAREGLVPEFLLYWLTAMQPEVLKIVDVANHGTKRLATERLHDLPLPVPPVDEQQRIVGVLRAVDLRLDAEVALLAERRRLKAALADALLAGKMRVPVQDGV